MNALVKPVNIWPDPVQPPAAEPAAPPAAPVAADGEARDPGDPNGWPPDVHLPDPDEEVEC